MWTTSWSMNINILNKDNAMKTLCYECSNRRSIPGDAHTQCVKPDKDMTGDEHGMRNGWFAYPYNFDPVWRTKECDNFEPIKEED